MKTPLFACMGLAAMAISALPSPEAHAIESANATSFCQGALPAFDTEIRKRPLAVRNEGTADAFVSCSIPTNYAGPNTSVSVYLVNRSAGTATVDCTFVDGIVTEIGGPGFPVYYPQSIALLAGAAEPLVWEASEFELTAFSTIANVSCALPPGTEIALIGAAEE